MTFSCIYVLYSELIHPYIFPPFYISPFLMVSLTGLNILYSFLYREDINLYKEDIHLLLPSPFC
jgi:hypothetical protein